ncbi:MAG: serine protease [Micavibrio aeruginosavorus]|uniref:Probable periplasmic serine endoprotease DegP-like n=1 Tax=Micavibrio aeruginosavorus TaxID=349221 RepID=A0A2W5PQQ2_9BACT|nr:MAG: serine protease [Micavibrio aeruginosavorus]
MQKHLTIFSALLVLSSALSPALTFAADEAVIAKPEGKTSPIPPGAPATFADIAHDLLPAVVNISSTLKVGATIDEEGMGLDNGEDGQGQAPEIPQLPPGSPFQDFFEEFMNKHGGQGGGAQPAIPPASLGSGFVIDGEKGYVVTNNHVIKDADEVRVTFGDDTTLVAKILGKDEKMDLALLQVPVEKGKKLAAVKFGDSDKMRVGDWVLAIGNPFGLGGTVTAGIISAQQRNINAGQYDDFIQTDASINRGNSGGPMFDLQGDVIGINTAIFSPSGGSVGIGFAIPSNMANTVIKQLIEYGKTRRGWIGVRIQSVTEEIAESLDLKTVHGALVASVTPGGPAEKAKLQPGDIITKFDGKEVNAMRNLPRIVAETPIDSTVELTFWRDGKEKTAKIKVGELEKAEETGLLSDEPAKEEKPAPAATTDLAKTGLSVGSVSETSRKTFNIPADVKGVVVMKVAPTSDAATKGLEPGDVIVEINQQAVDAPKQAADAIAKAEKDGKSSVLLLVNREGDVRFVALKLKK